MSVTTMSLPLDMQKQTNSAPSVPPNFEILPLKFWKVSFECPYLQ